MLKLEEIVGSRYRSLLELKSDIENITGKCVNVIMESESEKPDYLDYEIDVEFEPFNIYTIFYLKDNAGSYYITEV